MEKDLTVLIPVYNEGKTISKVIEEILKIPRLGELILIDDGSKDNTWQILQKYKNKAIVLKNDVNRGKGFTVRRGIDIASKKYFIVQDADLEYSPESIELLFQKLEEGNIDLINSKRNFKTQNVQIVTQLANLIVPLLIFFLYGKKITDVVSCYKLMETEKYRHLNLISDRFELETEIIAKSIKNKYKIVEVEIPFFPRSSKEGKHLKWTDGPKVMKLLLKYKLGTLKKKEEKN